MRVDTLPSRFVSPARVVYSYLPPARGNAPIAGVVYMGDGSAMTGIAPYIDTLIVNGTLPRVMLVGIPHGDARPDDPAGTDVRAMEYLMDYERGNKRFFAHERFVFEEVIPWAEATLGAPRSREQRAVWGISNSGGWAATMGARHADALGVVLAFSPGGAHGTIPPGASFTPAVRFLLQGGTLEPAFRQIAADWTDTLVARGLTPVFREVIAGHDWQVWCEQFPAALQWAWGRNERTAGVGNR
jgi:enterochelin esterase-like enzyme